MTVNHLQAPQSVFLLQEKYLLLLTEVGAFEKIPFKAGHCIALNYIVSYCIVFLCKISQSFPLPQVGIEAPTKAEFEAADLDGNGALLFNEWKDWVALQI